MNLFNPRKYHTILIFKPKFYLHLSKTLLMVMESISKLKQSQGVNKKRAKLITKNLIKVFILTIILRIPFGSIHSILTDHTQ